MYMLGLRRHAPRLAGALFAAACQSEQASDAPAPKSVHDASVKLVDAAVRADAAITNRALAADDPSAAAALASCNPSQQPAMLGIASASLRAKPPLELTESTRLLGDGLALTLMPQQNVAGGLFWRGDRLFVTADTGFWEVSPEHDARFYRTSSVILWGLRAGDLDRDGDQDLIVLTLEPNTAQPSAGITPTPFGSRLSAWERSKDGLTRRSDVMHTTEMRFAMPYVLGDVDGDRDLDVLTFEQGAPVAFMHDGAFNFTRQVLGESTPELRQSPPLLLDYSDRNADGNGDLLLILGSYSSQLQNTIHVLLADGRGKFGAPGPVSVGETPLVPHGPDGVGLGVADVTGDGIADVLQQDDQSTETAPVIRLFASQGASQLAAPIELEGLGFEFADVDEDGKLDVVSTLNNRLIALLSRGDGAFETRDLGVSTAAPDFADFVVDPGDSSAPAVLHTLYALRDCPTCGAACTGRCVFDVCVGCLSDADCDGAHCEAQTCAPRH